MTNASKLIIHGRKFECTIVFGVINEENVFLKQDRVPPYYALPVRNLLNEIFPDKWIRRSQ